MRLASLGVCLLSAALALPGCAELDEGAIYRPLSPTDDTGAPPVDTGIAPPDDTGVAPPVDTGPQPVDAGPPPVDAGPPPMDVPAPPVDVPTPPVDVPPPPVDVPAPPVDTGPMCMPCMGGPPGAVRFCGASTCPGAGVVGCTNNCATCTPPPSLRGNTCQTAPLIDGRGQVRTLLTTCGAADNLSIGCNRAGPDIAVGFRVQTRGRTRGTFTVPQGTIVNFGYSNRNEPCTNTTTQRVCNNAEARSTQSFDLLLDAGVYYLYVVTSQPTTIVFDLDLP